MPHTVGMSFGTDNGHANAWTQSLLSQNASSGCVMVPLGPNPRVAVALVLGYTRVLADDPHSIPHTLAPYLSPLHPSCDLDL